MIYLNLLIIDRTKPTVEILRNLKVINSSGKTIKLNQLMGNEKSIVVFLRHLVWLFCWSYANSLIDIIPEMKKKKT